MSKRRGSVCLEDLMPHTNLSRQEQQELLGLFKKAQPVKGQGISFYDFVEILKNFFPISQARRIKLLSDISRKEIRTLDVHFLTAMASDLKKQKQLRPEEDTKNRQYYDAFVALGGNPDGSGFVTKQGLIKTMINEFQLSIEQDSLDINGNGQQKLFFDDFCQLFQNPENVLPRTDSCKSVRVNEQDFVSYLARNNL